MKVGDRIDVYNITNNYNGLSKGDTVTGINENDGTICIPWKPAGSRYISIYDATKSGTIIITKLK